MESIKNVFVREKIYFSLQYYKGSDFSVGFELQSIAEHPDLFENLYSKYPLDHVDDLNSYYYFLLTLKISKMGKLGDTNEYAADLLKKHPDVAELVKQVAADASNVLKKTAGKPDITYSAIKYINEHKDDIFTEKQPDYELKYTSLDFIFTHNGGICNCVFLFLCQHCGRLVIHRFDDLFEICHKRQSAQNECKQSSENVDQQSLCNECEQFLNTDCNQSLSDRCFLALFPSGHFQLLNFLGLDDVLKIWGKESQKKDSPFIQVKEKYVDELCLDTEQFCKMLSADNIRQLNPTIGIIYSFLKKIKSHWANQFSKYARAADESLSKYLIIKKHEQAQISPAVIAAGRVFESFGQAGWLSLTHHLNGDRSGYLESFLAKSVSKDPILDFVTAKYDGNEVFPLSCKNLLTVLEVVQSEKFLAILNNRELLFGYLENVSSEIEFISKQMSLSETELSEDAKILFRMLKSVAKNTTRRNSKQKMLCYSSSMFLCALIEKLLRLFNKYRAKDDKYVPEDITLGDLLNVNNDGIAKVFGCVHVRYLSYFLGRIPNTNIGKNYRNRLAHLASDMSPRLMTPILTATIMWLFTDVLNSVSLYFEGQSDEGQKENSCHGG